MSFSDSNLLANVMANSKIVVYNYLNKIKLYQSHYPSSIADMCFISNN